MDSESSQLLVILILCLFLSAFFSMSETALTSLSKIRLRNMIDKKAKNAALIQKTLEDPHKLLTAILIGNNIVNIGASSLATLIAINVCNNLGISSANAVGIATGILTIVILIFGEITPKTFAVQSAEKVAIIVIRPIVFFVYLFTPIVFLLNVITKFLLKLLGVHSYEKTPIITESELLTMVNVSHEEGVLEVEEREMINNVVDFGNAAAKEIMVPRTDIAAIKVDANYDDLLEIFISEHYSRLPVYDENLDNIVGIISYKDIIAIEDKKNFKIKDIMREPFFTYEFKPARELFSQMQTKRISMAIVLDEYGGTAGIITLEDLLEEIVGDIADEFDDASEEIEIINADEYIVDGTTKIDDFNEAVGTEFESEDFDSIGGYLIGLIGRFPDKDETIEVDNVKFIVEDIDKNRIEKLRVLRIPEPVQEEIDDDSDSKPAQS